MNSAAILVETELDGKQSRFSTMRVSHYTVLASLANIGRISHVLEILMAACLLTQGERVPSNRGEAGGTVNLTHTAEQACPF